MRISPTIAEALNNDKRAVRLYLRDDNFARAVLKALFSIGNNVVAERLANKAGIKGFKLNWTYPAFFGLKCATWSARKVTDPEIAKSVFTSNGLHSKDARVLEDIKRLRLSTTINRFKLLHVPDIHVAASLSSKLVKEIQPSFFKYARRKLAFIVKFYPDKSIEDIALAMMEKAIYAFYRAYPLKSEQHIINSMRVAGYNYALNIIEFQQREKRREISGIDEGTNGYTLTSISIDKPASEHENDQGESKTVQLQSGDTLIAEDTISRYEYGRFLAKCSVKQRKIVRLLSMEVDEPFMKYVRTVEPRLKRVYKPDSAANAIGLKAYKRLVRKFLKVKRKPFNRFIDNLKSVVSVNGPL